MLADGIDRQLDPLALHDYLSLNYVPGPKTMFSAIRKLLPGHILTFEADSQKMAIHRYWDVPQPPHKLISQIQMTSKTIY